MALWIGAIPLACTSGASVTQGNCVADGASRASVGDMAAACATARERFTELTGYRAAEVRIEFGDSTAMSGAVERSSIVLRVPRPETLAATAASLGNSAPLFGTGWEESVTNIARHEVGHLLLAAALHDTAAGGSDVRYGTELPDWFDEAVAQWGETDESRKVRLAQAHSDEPQVGSLREFVNSTHPLTGNESVLEQHATTTFGPCRGNCGPDYRAGSRTIRHRLMNDGTIRTDTTWTSPGVEPPIRAVEVFYPISLSIITFVRERFGAQGTNQLAARLVRGEASEEALGALMPEGGFEAFERQWRAWLRHSSE